MAKRKSGLSDLMEIFSKLPWPMSAVLVPLSYLGCHWAAVSSPPALGTNLGQMAPVVFYGYVYVFAAVLQYILPLVFLFTAAASWVGRSRSKALLTEALSRPAAVTAMSWQDFERLVAEGFRVRGFQVTDRGGAGADGGVDLELVRSNERFLVQCKQWRAQQVSVSVVRELYGVMAAERVAGGYVVTSGTFTKDAKAFASGRNIELIDGKGLDRLLREGQSAPPATPKPTTTETNAPLCPACKTPMVVRVAKRGSNPGSSFWGCVQYPKCRQTASIE